MSKDVVHGITSLDVEQASAEAVARWVRSHWGIENKIHYGPSPGAEISS